VGDRSKSPPESQSAEKATTELAPIELQALLRETVESPASDHETVEMMPLVAIVDDDEALSIGDPSKLARGSEAVAPQQKPLVSPRPNRRRRESLRVEQILPKAKIDTDE
jgi:hypothetical protein